MTKDELKEKVLNIIDSFDEYDLKENEGLLYNPDEEILSEFIALKGEVKKSNKLFLKTELNTDKFIKFNENLLNAMDSLINLKIEDDVFNEFKIGLNSTLELWQNILDEIELRELAKVGDIFNSEIHEAMEVVSEDRFRDREIVEIIKQGYSYKDNILSYAQVKINKSKG